MNIKKSFLSALACATAFASISAFAVSAATPGISDGDGEKTTVPVVTGEDTKAVVTFDDGKTFTAVIPAGATDSESVTVQVVPTVDLDLDKIKADKNFKDAQVLNLYFTDAEGNEIDSEEGIELTVDGSEYNAVYVLDEDGTLTVVEAELVDGQLKFNVPALKEGQKLVLAVEDKTDDQSSQPDDTSKDSTTPNNQSSNTTVVPNNNNTGSNNGGSANTGSNGSTNNAGSNGTSNDSNGSAAQTGDNNFTTTVAVFSIMAVVALVTAVVASKAKKATK